MPEVTEASDSPERQGSFSNIAGASEVDGFLDTVIKSGGVSHFKKIREIEVDIEGLVRTNLSPCSELKSATNINKKSSGGSSPCVDGRLTLTGFARDKKYLYFSVKDSRERPFMVISDEKGVGLCSAAIATNLFRNQRAYVAALSPIPSGGVMILINSESDWSRRFENSFQLVSSRLSSVPKCLTGNSCPCEIQDFADLNTRQIQSAGSNNVSTDVISRDSQAGLTSLRESHDLFSSMFIYPLSYTINFTSFGRELTEATEQMGLLLLNQIGENSWHCDFHGQHCGKVTKVGEKNSIIQSRQCWGSYHYALCSAAKKNYKTEKSLEQLLLFSHSPGEQGRLSKIDMVIDISPFIKKTSKNWFFGPHQDGITFVYPKDNIGLCVNDRCWHQSLLVSTWGKLPSSEN